MKLNSLRKDKRGLGIGDLYPIILIIATVAILLGILLLVFVEWTNVTNTNTQTVFNETLIDVGELGEVVTNSSRCGFNDFEVLYAQNGSGATTLIPTTNYTISSTTGTVYSVVAGTFNGTNWNVTYTYSYGKDDCEAIESITSDFVDFVPWIGIILLVVAAAIVLGVVISSFRNRRV